MMYQYVLVVTGQVEAPAEEHAQLQALMGVSLTGRLLLTPHEVAVKVTPVVERSDGREPVQMEH